MANRPLRRDCSTPDSEKAPSTSWWLRPDFNAAAITAAERMKREKPSGAVRHTLGLIERDDHLNAGGAHRGYRLSRWRS